MVESMSNSIKLARLINEWWGLHNFQLDVWDNFHKSKVFNIDAKYNEKENSHLATLNLGSSIWFLFFFFFKQCYL